VPDQRVRLRGICWDHARCVKPMAAAAAVWRSVRGVEVAWDARPLSAFNDQPVEELAADYDLIVFDHPMVGAAARAGCLAPLDDLLPDDVLDAHAADTVGGSHASYQYAGHQWGLAVDAACQVAAFRPDLLAAHEVEVPATWDDVVALARALPGKVVLPLYPADAFCSLLTISASLGTPLDAEASGFHRDAVALLATLAQVVDRSSFSLNPPALLDRMTSDDAIVYVPLLFGYTNYSRPSTSGRPVRFTNIPTAGIPTAFSPGGCARDLTTTGARGADASAVGTGEATGPRGSTLGGAGIGVSATSAHRVEAAAFASWVSGTTAQRYVVLPNEGQPASAATWSDPEADALVGGFFRDTRATMDAVWTRPRTPWWRAFQEEASGLLAEELSAGSAPAEIVRVLDRLLDDHRRARDGR
jgi:multiple sugar transport system substrate-binding protein